MVQSLTPPVAELHLHLEGTLEPDMILALAERNGIDLPYAGLDDLLGRYEFASLQDFLDLYYVNLQVLRTERDFADLTGAYLRRAALAGVRHAEVFCDIQAHLERGVPVAVALGGVSAALGASESEHGISSGLIVTFLKHLSGDDAIAAYDEVRATGLPILGVGLCSTEIGNPAEKFAELFRRARADGLHVVAHAGEEGDASYVWDVLDVLAVERVDHGIRSMEDPRLVERLVREQVPLTVCPLSNVRLRAVTDLASHPLPAMLDAGLLVTVNSDDPAYFGGYVDDNLAAVQQAFQLSREQLARLARNSFEASFLPAERKQELGTLVDAWLGS